MQKKKSFKLNKLNKNKLLMMKQLNNQINKIPIKMVMAIMMYMRLNWKTQKNKKMIYDKICLVLFQIEMNQIRNQWIDKLVQLPQLIKK